MGRILASEFITDKEKLAKYTQSIGSTCPICDRADKFMVKNQYKKAIGEYLSSLMQKQNNTRALKGVAKAYKKLKLYDYAIKHLKSALNITSFDSEIYYELGINYLLNAEPEGAIREFRKSIRLDKKNVNAQIQLAIAHELSGEEEMALSIYSKILEENPKSTTVYNHLAGLYMQKGDFASAKNVFIQMLKISPNYHRGFLGLGICLDRLNEPISAVRYYKKYIAQKPKSKTSYALVNRICEIYSSKTKSNVANLKVLSF